MAVPDGLRAELLRSDAHHWAQILINVVNAAHDTNTPLPTCFTKSMILVLYKKGAAENVVDYRQIALVNFVAKMVSTVF